MPMPLSQAVRFVAEEGGREAVRYFRTQLQVEDKSSSEEGAFDPVTQADQKAEARMRALIEAQFPEHAILGEELGAKQGTGWRWVLDPVDGTRGFVCGIPTWTTLVGLERASDGGYEPGMGVIRQAFLNETWFGDVQSSKYHRGAETLVCCSSSCASLGEARLATTDPRSAPFGPMSKPEAAAFDRVARQARLTRFGMDAYAYGLLALGQIDLVIESGLQHYDMSALLPIVRGAGAVATDWLGMQPKEGGSLVVAATETLHQQALKALNAQPS